ncbi:MAG: septum formation initiator family protein [Negativicutes bacterium]|nr:septum formation initiator family protein [Negativicutes bacterium]
MCAAGYFFYVLAGQQLELNAIHRETEASRQKLEQLKQVNASLNEELERLKKPSYIEKLAREELGLVKPGEVPYIPAGKN